MNKFRLLMFATGLLLFSNVQAEGRLETYALQQRQARELIPIIKPLLPPGSAINGQAYTLIVRGDETTHATVRQILQKLDSKLHNLQIEVRFSTPTLAHRDAAGAQVRLHTRDEHLQANASAGTTPAHSNATIDLGGKSASLHAGLDEQSAATHNQSDYRIRVLEGRAAYIQTGSTIPYRTQTIYPGGARQTSVQFHDAQSGFYVRPRLNGEQVLLDILPRQQQPAEHGRIDTQQVQTTVSGTLGEWIELGGVSTRQRQHTSQSLYTRTNTLNKNTSIFVKVEIIP